MAEQEMVATYQVGIFGIERTKREMERLDTAIRNLRGTSYAGGGQSTATSASLGAADVFANRIVLLRGRVQTAATKAVITAMDKGKDTQKTILRNATTRTGRSGRSHVGGRRGPGREDSGAMIDAISRGVESQRTGDTTMITGYHGWKLGRKGYFSYQENGAGRVGAANSLGGAIVIVRELLKAELGRIKQ